MDYFDVYGQLAQNLNSKALISGRMSFHEKTETLIFKDVLQKLKLEKSHTLLEIGCGIGVILTPLSKYVKTAVGLDHEQMIVRYKKMGVPKNVTLIAGRWPDKKVKGTFDRILIYSVLHYLSDSKTSKDFIYKCLDILRPGGILMVGDITNIDLANRSKKTKLGEKIHSEYIQKKEKFSNDKESIYQKELFFQVPKLNPYLSDKFIIELLSDLRKKNCESYVMPQPRELPFSCSREDLIIYKH